MTNNNIENNNDKDETLEQELENTNKNNAEDLLEAKEEVEAEGQSKNSVAEEVDTAVLEDSDKISNEDKKMINYLDKSIINIKQWDYHELENDGNITSNENEEIYNSGLDKKERDVVKGTIVRVNEKDVFVDIGFKSEGIISKSEFKNSVPIVGDTVDVYIITFEDRKGNLILSRENAEFMLKW